MNKKSKPKVFISYAHEDQTFAMEIFNLLKTNGCSPWIDVHELKPGQDWKLEIDKAIQSSTFFVACLSSNSVSKRGYVQKELKSALSVLDLMPEGVIYLLPVRLDECTVPNSLSNRQWLDWDSPNAKRKILEAIGVKIESEIKQEKDNNDNETRAWKADLLTNTKRSRTLKLHLSTSNHVLSIQTENFEIWLDSKIVYKSYTSFEHPNQVVVQLTDGKITRDAIIRSTQTPGMRFLKNVQVKVDGVMLYNEI